MKKTYYNGNIITVDKNETIAQAVLVKNGIITAVGSNEDILALSNDCEKVDLEGKTMVPGFYDPHGHIVAMAQSLLIVTLGDVSSIEELLNKLKNELKTNPPENGLWLVGFGYDNSKFKDRNHPTKFDLDKISTEIPITVSHASGHLAVVNSKALIAYGYVGEDYKVPVGGIVRTVSSSSKEPNGVLEENAILDPAKASIPKSPGFADVLKAMVKVQDLYASLGITTSQDASVSEVNHYLQILGTCAEKNMLKIDIAGYVTQPSTLNLMKNEGTAKRNYHNHFKLAGGKTWLDGSPQGFTAWLTRPYHVIPKGKPADYCGYGTQDDDTVTKYFVECIRLNIQVNIHSNGDAATDQFIRCYSEALKLTNNKVDLRPVIIHGQCMREDQLDKIKELGAIISFFNDHVRFWGDLHYEQVFGPERAQNISPLRWAKDRDINITLHQDAPVKIPNQLIGIHTAVNRTTQSGRVLGEHQKLSVMEALKAVTINAAYQYFEEDTKGSIEVGKLADLVILDKNILEVEKLEIDKIKVLETIKEGETIYKM